jgi:hypothetical protein
VIVINFVDQVGQYEVLHLVSLPGQSQELNGITPAFYPKVLGSIQAAKALKENKWVESIPGLTHKNYNKMKTFFVRNTLA